MVAISKQKQMRLTKSKTRLILQLLIIKLIFDKTLTIYQIVTCFVPQSFKSVAIAKSKKNSLQLP